MSCLASRVSTAAFQHTTTETVLHNDDWQNIWGIQLSTAEGPEAPQRRLRLVFHAGWPLQHDTFRCRILIQHIASVSWHWIYSKAHWGEAFVPLSVKKVKKQTLAAWAMPKVTKLPRQQQITLQQISDQSKAWVNGVRDSSKCITYGCSERKSGHKSFVKLD